MYVCMCVMKLLLKRNDFIIIVRCKDVAYRSSYDSHCRCNQHSAR